MQTALIASHTVFLLASSLTLSSSPPSRSLRLGCNALFCVIFSLSTAPLSLSISQRSSPPPLFLSTSLCSRSLSLLLSLSARSALLADAVLMDLLGCEAGLRSLSLTHTHGGSRQRLHLHSSPHSAAPQPQRYTANHFKCYRLNSACCSSHALPCVRVCV